MDYHYDRLHLDVAVEDHHRSHRHLVHRLILFPEVYLSVHEDPGIAFPVMRQLLSPDHLAQAFPIR